MNLWPLGLRLQIGGIVLIVVGLLLFALKGFTIVLALPVVGIILILLGFIWKRKK
jgi:hypothetical protein